MSKVTRYEGLELNRPGDTTIDASNNIAGRNVAFVNANADSREGCLEEVKHIITDIVRTKENFLWFSDEYMLP